MEKRKIITDIIKMAMGKRIIEPVEKFENHYILIPEYDASIKSRQT